MIIPPPESTLGAYFVGISKTYIIYIEPCEEFLVAKIHNNSNYSSTLTIFRMPSGFSLLLILFLVSFALLYMLLLHTLIVLWNISLSWNVIAFYMPFFYINCSTLLLLLLLCLISFIVVDKNIASHTPWWFLKIIFLWKQICW